MAGTLHTKAQIDTYLSSALIVGLVAVAAAWMIVRDHQAAVDNAEHHLENLAVVVSQQTAFALRTTGEGAVAVTAGRASRTSSEMTHAAPVRLRHAQL